MTHSERRQPIFVVMAMVAINLGINAINAQRNWSELTFLHHLVALVLWVTLPLLAVALLWRGRTIGHWLLVVLFGCRGIIEAFLVAPLLASDSSLLLSEPGWRYTFHALFYLGAAGWLFFLGVERTSNAKQRPPLASPPRVT